MESLIDSFELKQVILREATQRRLDSLTDILLRERGDSRPDYPLPEGIMFLMLLLVLATTAYIYVLKPTRDANIRKKEKYKLNPEHRVMTDKQHDHWLNKYNPYYASLPPELKQRFIARTQKFLFEKEFRFHSMVEEEYIPVLVSGAAVQMTFGLKNYMMDYFPVIHVIRKEYVLNVDKETYYGHVSRNGIYISWTSFLEGYNDYADSVNVGLHEMAHAVSYDLFLGEQDGHDMEFRERLSGFAREGTAVFRSMRNGGDHIFDDYARTNFDEFWAVCVETFFENPIAFQREQPVLYQSLCDLLNQNPLEYHKIIDNELAGLEI
jgi:Mlc titration factor MtfA (ptsG expression regulator)